MKQYVRITFTPKGSRRRRTCWAVKRGEKNGFVTYTVCGSGGNTKRGRYQRGTLTEQTEVIIATPAEVVEQAARMNNRYAELEVVGTLPDPYKQAWDTETEERGIRFDARASGHSVWDDPDPKAILDCQPEADDSDDHHS